MTNSLGPVSQLTQPDTGRPVDLAKLRLCLSRVVEAFDKNDRLTVDIAQALGMQTKYKPNLREWHARPASGMPWHALPDITADAMAALSFFQAMLTAEHSIAITQGVGEHAGKWRMIVDDHPQPFAHTPSLAIVAATLNITINGLNKLSLVTVAGHA